MNNAITAVDTGNQLGGTIRSGAPGGPAGVVIYLVRLRPDLATHDVASLVHHVRSLGAGEVNAQPMGGAWSLALTSLSDLQLLARQHADLIEGHSVLNENQWQMPEAGR